ncbi:MULTISPECIES: DUF4250 domain-containing protein [Clostridium]|uniref:DUF4250 domain-containing protein n=1 Tax=Clostridium paridis TaxID=2803863 RepID=A0A937FFL5_9CLOT|nr:MULTISPECIES: DUF4250 domain-containing protein [Clostridium]MBL4932464.1 DUF4250 domain-containing protein [Clostridium paridis]
MDREEIFNRDPIILLSMVNMKLRDFYSSLDNYCYEEEIDQNALIERLKEAGYEYNSSRNAFV